MPVFEVGLYNRDVRECVDEGRHHPHLKDEWEDIHYFEVEADTADEARRKIVRSYPTALGFVIESVELVSDDG